MKGLCNLYEVQELCKTVGLNLYLFHLEYITTTTNNNKRKTASYLGMKDRVEQEGN